MANEITVGGSLSLTNGNLDRQITIPDLSPDQASAIAMSNVQSIPTTAAGTAIDVADVANQGWALLKNNDATNYIELGIQTGGVFFPFAKLLPSEWCLTRLAVTTAFARANTGACELDYSLLET
jgi:hypothetical protein